MKHQFIEQTNTFSGVLHILEYYQKKKAFRYDRFNWVKGKTNKKNKQKKRGNFNHFNILVITLIKDSNEFRLLFHFQIRLSISLIHLVSSKKTKKKQKQKILPTDAHTNISISGGKKC